MNDREKPTVRPPATDVAMDADAVDRRAGELRMQADTLMRHAAVLHRTASLMRAQLATPHAERQLNPSMGVN